MSDICQDRQGWMVGVAIVTGAARGIGGAIASALAREGEHVVVSDVDEMHGLEKVILNVSSVAGLGLGPHEMPAYAATKAAINKLTASLTSVQQSHKIRVNAICPDSATARAAAFVNLGPD